ncbi:MAG: hypothetical protein ACE37F_32235 [Nannocystaceae bacterium]|nr:hypothetical protein [bacterium]
MRRALPFIALSMLSALLPSCTNTCTLVGCGPAVTLLVGSEDAPLDPSVAQYQVDLDLDGQAVVVTCITGQTQCDIEGNDGPFWVEALSYPDRLEIGINSGEELAPHLIEVYVLADDTQIHEGGISPTYSDEEINGEGCGVCRTADDGTFVLPGS